MRNVFVYHWLYRLAVCLLVPLAMGGVTFGGWLCLQWLFDERATTLSTVICLFSLTGIVALCLLLPAYLVKVLTWKLTVSDECFTVAQAWRRYSLPFTLVDKYKIDALGIYLRSRKRFVRSVSVSFFIEDYSSLALLVYRRLGKRSEDLCSSQERIFENKLLGDTPEQSISKYRISILLYYLITALGWQIGVFLLIMGYPYWLSSITCLMIPFVCLWAIVHTKGLITFYAMRDYTTYRPEFFRLILFCCSAITFRLALDYALHPDGLVWPITFCLGLILYFGFNRTAFYRASLRTSKSMRWIIPALCLVYGYLLTVIINCQLDMSPTEQQVVEVTTKKVVSSLLPTPMVELDIWNRSNPTSFIMLTLSLYDSLSKGDHVAIGVHRGLLGIPWYRRSYSIFNEGELEVRKRGVQADRFLQF